MKISPISYISLHAHTQRSHTYGRYSNTLYTQYPYTLYQYPPDTTLYTIIHTIYWYCIINITTIYCRYIITIIYAANTMLHILYIAIWCIVLYTTIIIYLFTCHAIMHNHFTLNPFHIISASILHSGALGQISGHNKKP